MTFWGHTHLIWSVKTQLLKSRTPPTHLALSPAIKMQIFDIRVFLSRPSVLQVELRMHSAESRRKGHMQKPFHSLSTRAEKQEKHEQGRNWFHLFSLLLSQSEWHSASLAIWRTSVRSHCSSMVCSRTDSEQRVFHSPLKTVTEDHGKIVLKAIKRTTPSWKNLRIWIFCLKSQIYKTWFCVLDKRKENDLLNWLGCWANAMGC